MYDRNDRGNRRAQRSEAQQPAEETEGQLEGRNAIAEALKSGRTIDKLFIASGDTDKSLQRLAAQAKEADGVIIPKRRSVGLTATVAKASAGAMEYMKVARVSNINAAMQELKDKGVWIFGTAAEGAIPMYKADLKGPAAIVIGNEGVGMSQLVRKNCDVIVSIPMAGRISSLNASAAASILLYEAVRQRLG